MLKNIKTKTVVLVLGILLTFGLIVAAAPNLPADAETIVTTEQGGPGGGGRGDRDGRRGDRPPRGERGPQPAGDFDDFFDF